MSALDRIADLLSRPIILIFSIGLRLLGPVFIIAFYFLLILHVYSFFIVILYGINKRLGTVCSLIWISIGLCLVYNVAFNHFFATIIKAGSPIDLKSIEQKRKEIKNRETRGGIKQVHDESTGKIKFVEDDRFENASKDVKKLLRYRTKTVSQLEQFWKKKCSECKYIKPIRTHHCSVCQRCVIMMDHHCPWVNNCLGLENHRYFLLFIFYLFVGIIYYLITVISIWHHYQYKQHQAIMSFLLIMDSALGVVLVGFNIWNWFLAMSGYSTIEYWGYQTRKDKEKYDFNFRSIKDNLYKTFGTYNFIQIFSPSLRNLPFNGIEWSYQMKDLGYNEKGQRIVQDIEQQSPNNN